MDEITVAPNASVPYPGTPLKVGSTGYSVSLMQFELNAIKQYIYPTLTFLKVDGIFGYGTQSTVIQYQKIKGLTPDGIIGQLTWSAITSDYESIPDPATEIYPGTPLSQGSTGISVVNMQKRLNACGQVYTAIAQQSEDGIFGSNMANATRLFQKQFALAADEVIGEDTWNGIVSVQKSVSQSTPVSVTTSYPGSPVSYGASGDSVRFIQSYLNTVSSKLGNPFITVTVDGVFGAKTKSQVMGFQSYYSLSPDGVVGTKTWAKMIAEFNTLV